MSEDLPTLLRNAASRITELADKATPGPWSMEKVEVFSQGEMPPVRAVIYGPRVWDGLIPVAQVPFAAMVGDARWIAQMSPVIARPLASWLKDVANDLEGEQLLDPQTSQQQHAVELARALFQEVE